ncbi:MAG: redoxin domain-containing protein, partial [Elusimicrobia bacterium]|nr:redoxin domain-containing protein [Elusimicrobiota bacterium]
MKSWLWKLRCIFAGKDKVGLERGELFPRFMLEDCGGRPYSIPDTTKKSFTLLWFTNLCEDCRSRIPILNELRECFGDRVSIYAISLLGRDLELPRNLEKTIGFPMLIDPEDIVSGKLNLPHPPDTCPLFNLFVLDPQGTILFKHHLSAAGSSLKSVME